MNYKQRESYIWKRLIAAGYREIEAAGIMGNLQEESGLSPINLQYDYEKILHMTDQEYTDKVNSGEYSYKQFYSDHAGYGLAQWTYYSRKQYMYKTCWPDIGSLDKQCDYLIKELAWYPHVVAKLHKCKTIKECSDVILHQYECPADQSLKAELRRAAHGEKIYKEMHVEPQPVSGWYVCQCASYKTEKGAIAAAQKLKNAHVYKSHAPGYFAVALGQYTTEKEAAASADMATAKAQRKDAFIAYYKQEDLVK